ncbi:hypothetical protein A2U01_0071970, partial [Trifolium medium]|nr:hypothetical protein [Trifolium medium]
MASPSLRRASPLTAVLSPNRRRGFAVSSVPPFPSFEFE